MAQCKESACQGRRSGKPPHAAEQLSRCATATAPVLYSPFSAREATSTRSPHAAPREKPHSNEKPAQPQINKTIKKKDTDIQSRKGQKKNRVGLLSKDGLSEFSRSPNADSHAGNAHLLFP